MIDYAERPGLEKAVLDEPEKPVNPRDVNDYPPNSARLWQTDEAAGEILASPGWLAFVTAVAAPCCCEGAGGRTSEQCAIAPIDRRWLLEPLLSEEQLVAFELFHAHRIA